MKKFVIKLFYFAVFFTIYFILINVFYLAILLSTDLDFKKRFESLKLDNPDIEYLILGASTSSVGFNCELLTLNGLKSYNLALSGNSIRTSYIQLNEYLTLYSKKPQYVLIGVNSAIESFNNDVIHPIVEVTMKDHNYSTSDIPILKFKWLGFEFFKKIISKEHRKAKLSYGQLRIQKHVSDKTNYNELYLNIADFESIHWIGEIAKLCNHNGI
ncbi:MAG TPA: hypothetical protein VIK14_12135, partial [Ignavibacteria bacterium]